MMILFEAAFNAHLITHIQMTASKSTDNPDVVNQKSLLALPVLRRYNALSLCGVGSSIFYTKPCHLMLPISVSVKLTKSLIASTVDQWCDPNILPNYSLIENSF